MKHIAAEFRRAIGTGKDAPTTNGVDVLGWDFAFELNEVATASRRRQRNIQMRPFQNPARGDGQEGGRAGRHPVLRTGALAVEVKTRGRAMSTLTLTDFVDSAGRRAGGRTQGGHALVRSGSTTGRSTGTTRATPSTTSGRRIARARSPTLAAGDAAHLRRSRDEYTIVVKVIDILGNDTTKTIKVEVK